MKTMTLKELAPQTKIADQFLSRFIGFMMKPKIADQEAILFPDCKSLHMLFMLSSIDVAFLKRTSKKEWKIIKTHHRVMPWLPWPLVCMGADDVIELAPGRLQQLQLKEGDLLCSA